MTVRLTYPPAPSPEAIAAARARREAAQAAAEERAMRVRFARTGDMGPRNYNYDKRDPDGCPLLAPLSVFDDGTRTTLLFAPHAVLPEIYVINQDGKEAVATTVNDTTRRRPAGHGADRAARDAAAPRRQGVRAARQRLRSGWRRTRRRQRHGLAGGGAPGADAMSGEVITPHGPSPVARGRTYLPGRLRAAMALGCCCLVFGVLVWMMWPRAGARAGTVGGDRDDVGHGPGPARSAAPGGARATTGGGRRPCPAAPDRARGDARRRARRASRDGVLGGRQRGSAIGSTGRVPDSGRFSVGRVRRRGRRSGRGRHPDPAATTRSACKQRASPTRRRCRIASTFITRSRRAPSSPARPSQPISSSLPGPVRCTADQDVWSMDGTTILLPRGTQVNGTVERGLTGGEERLFLVWTDALTPRPDLLAIPLDSPAADETGPDRRPGRRQRSPVEAHQNGVAAERGRVRRQRRHGRAAAGPQQHVPELQRCRGAPRTRWRRWRSGAT